MADSSLNQQVPQQEQTLINKDPEHSDSSNLKQSDSNLQEQNQLPDISKKSQNEQENSMQESNIKNGKKDQSNQLRNSQNSTQSKELPPINGKESDRNTFGSQSSRFEMSLGRVLGESKKNRRQLDIEATIMYGRISLLKQEEENTKKKIYQTKKQTQEYFHLKKQNEEQLFQKNKNKGEEEELLRQRWLENERLRLRRKLEMEEIKKQINSENKSNYITIKKEQEINEKRAKQIVERHLEMNQRKKLFVQQQELKSTMNILEFKNRQTERYLENYKNWIEDEDYLKQKKQQEIKQMEQLELTLIKKLQATQMIQKKAFEELQGITTMRSEDFSQEFNPIFSKKKISKLISSTTDQYLQKDEQQTHGESKLLASSKSVGDFGVSNVSEIQGEEQPPPQDETKIDPKQNGEGKEQEKKNKKTKSRNLIKSKMPVVDFVF